MSNARVMCPACNREYSLAPGVAVNTPSLCPHCGKTDLPMFLHEHGGSNRAAITVALGCLGASGLCLLGIVALAAVWFLHAPSPPRPQPPRAREIPEPAPRSLQPSVKASPRIAVEVPKRLTESPADESLPDESFPNAERVPAPMTPADDQPPVLEPRPAPKRSPPATSPAKKSVPVKQLPDTDGLRYGWPKGDSRQYTFRIEATVDEDRVRSSGSVIYTVISTADELDAAIPAEEGSGSAFVVSARGHLVTCAHVVTGATEVQVQLGDATYPASILAADQARDLAILKIQADDLQPLPLGESSQVQLAQEVRVAGYPLSDVLGTSVKVTRGIVAGFIDQDQEPLLQVDAGINPGNSGGPLLDATGRVIGVASAKLSGEAISNVGFAVPVDDVKRLLDAHHVDTPRSQPADLAVSDRTLQGPELAKRVTPGVALLRVRTGPGGFAAAPRLGIRFSGSVTTRDDGRARYRREPFGMRLPPMPPIRRSSAPALEHGRMVLDIYGEILEADGEQSLPFLLGPLSAMAFEPLGDPGRTTWQTHRTTGIRHIRRPDNPTPDFFRPPRIRFPSPYGPRHAFEEEPQEAVIAVHSAIEHVRYAITETAGDVWTIEKSYRLKTVDAEATEDAPVLSLIGDGRIRFDRASGAPIDQDFEATLTVDRPNASLRIPVTFHYELFAPQDLADGRETEQGTDAASEQPTPAPPSTAETAPPARQLTPQEVAALTESLQSEDLVRRRVALTTLANAEADPVPQAVTQQLLELLSSDDLFTRITATRAMARWGTPEATPTLIQKLDDGNVAVRQYAVDALIAIGDPSGAEALVDRWKRLPGMGLPALMAMGTVGESAALRLLAHEDASIRVDGCRILAKIGTRACTEPLEQRFEDSSPDVQRAARDARESVRKRVDGEATE